MGQTKDVLPAVPPVELSSISLPMAKYSSSPGFSGQLFQREDAVIFPALLRLLHLPAADLEAEAHLRASSAKQPHISPERAGGGCPLLEGERPPA